MVSLGSVSMYGAHRGCLGEGEGGRWLEDWFRNGHHCDLRHGRWNAT